MRHLDALALRIFQLFHDYPVDPLELTVSCHAIGYGFWLAMPFDTFGSSRSFADVRQFVTEQEAGTIFLLVGALWLIGLLTKHRHMRIGAASAAAFCYIYWSVMLGTANFTSVGWWTYAIFAFMALWAVNRNYSRMIGP